MSTQFDKHKSDKIPFVKIGKPNKTGHKTIKNKTKKTKKNKTIYSPELIDKYKDLIQQTNENKQWSQSHSIKPDYWKLSNRKSSSGWIDKTFGTYRIKKQLDNYDEELDKNKNVKLFIHQKFLKDFLQPSSPYRGLLLYHGLGSGKSCSSISIAEGLKEFYPVYVLTPKSLQLNFKNELKKCGNVLYQLNQHWDFMKIDMENKEEVDFFMDTYHISKKRLLKFGGLWINNMEQPVNYNHLDNEERIQINQQIDEQIENDYKFIAYNGLRLNKINQMIENSETGNIFDNCVVVIDEVHNLVSTIANNSKIGTLLYKLLLEAKNVKIVLLTGTPIINYPHEIAIISNILRGLIKQYTIKIKTKGKIDIIHLENILTQINTIDQFFIEPRNNTIKITRNPYHFSNHYKEHNYLGVLQYNNEMLEKEWLETIKLILIENKYQLVDKIVEEDFKALPDIKKDFNHYFIDTNTNCVKNHILFKKRILGTISYYSGASQDLYPDINAINIVEIPLSDYQFKKYEVVRNIERELEGKSKSKNKSKDEDSFSSYYKVFSRMLSNFVFPEKIYRPYTQKLVNEIDIIDDAGNDQDDDIIDEPDVNFSKLKLKAWNSLVKEKDHLLTLDKLTLYSPKIKKMIENINNSPGNVFIYSQFKTLEGINTIALALQTNGYAPLKIGKNSDGDYIELFDNPEDIMKPKYAIFEGSDAEKDLLIKIFNNQLELLPTTLRNSLLQRDTNNLHGNLLKIMLATSSGAEGIHLENIRQVHITEPYWNPIRIEQVIGRAVRYKSHIHLPRNERNVDIFIYISIFTQNQLDNASFTLKTRDTNPIKQLDNTLPDVLVPTQYPCFTSDQHIFYVAYKKEKITKEFFSLMKEAAVDCNLNAIQNEDIKCFTFGSKVTDQDYSYIPNIKLDEGIAYQQQQQQKTQITGKKIMYNKQIYILSEDDGIVYDYHSWIGDSGKGNKAIIVGYLKGSQIEFLT